MVHDSVQCILAGCRPREFPIIDIFGIHGQSSKEEVLSCECVVFCSPLSIANKGVANLSLTQVSIPTKELQAQRLSPSG